MLLQFANRSRFSLKVRASKQRVKAAHQKKSVLTSELLYFTPYSALQAVNASLGCSCSGLLGELPYQKGKSKDRPVLRTEPVRPKDMHRGPEISVV